MAKSWKPKLPNAFQPWKPPKQVDPFKMPKFPDPFKPLKEPKIVEPPHVMTIYEDRLIRELCPVIRNKQLIKFWYNDKTTDFEGWRLIEPHLIGQTKYKAANIWLVGWFLPTTQQLIEGREEKWGNYILDDVSKLEILPQKYRYTRPLYNPHDKRMTTIFCATS